LNSRSWSHNPTPQPLGHRHIWCLRERSNLRIRLFRPVLVHLSYTGESGGDGENRTLIGWVQTSSPPVERRPHGCGGGNRTHLMAAYETAVRASSSSPHQTGPGSQDRTDGLSIIGRVLNQLSFSRWSPVPESNSLPRFTGAAHRQQCLRGAKPGASGANRTLVGRLPCACSATELHRLEPKGGFEPPSELYEGSVFPTKLLRLGASNRIRTGVRTMARSNPSR
jgi:hypothetical protein